MRSGKPDETWFDYPFTVLVKSVKEKVMATITMPPQEAAALGAAPAPSAGSAEVKKLKQTIDAQHREITMLKQQAAATVCVHVYASSEL
ncbi:hypothetical protein SARC_17222 [Sphaeroforma arctica JP610]|uniref:Uncharacterized protein n=1 Tax=Sphaeroforma arctica JP610 TaxID=667725 RepID=A0A0L0F0M3_9EUKA|nr:hypothetical protein SARC_17222 [Sphaeroforma arctica JP610]KNC70252.1 hypothetical protein SARC_17222 [Sphaeroforma arctica JP610]|eukprot:XP_014144154.1 hypothetical protein SARC_17222 [Sphaeroforma arctica JP610]